MIDVNYAKTIFRYLNIEVDLKDLFSAIKGTMLCLSYSKLASIRTLTIKSIKKLIKINPQNLLDENIQKIIEYRICDTSATTRENTLDLIMNFVVKEAKYQEKYFPVIVMRADDASIGVRKKVIQILSLILEKSGRQDIIKILISKWEDSNASIK